MNSKSRFSRPKAKGKFRKWPAYNENLRKRGSLLLWITPKALKEWGKPEKIPRGAPRIYCSGLLKSVWQSGYSIISRSGRRRAFFHLFLR